MTASPPDTRKRELTTAGRIRAHPLFQAAQSERAHARRLALCSIIEHDLGVTAQSIRDAIRRRKTRGRPRTTERCPHCGK